jgi:hypothetical protein
VVSVLALVSIVASGALRGPARPRLYVARISLGLAIVSLITVTS